MRLSLPAPSRPGSRVRRPLVAALTVGVLAGGGLVGGGVAALAAAQSVPAPPAPLALPAEPSTPEELNSSCDPTDKPGVVAFARLLVATYPGSVSWGIARPCSGGSSEHNDGRALDWHADTSTPQGRADVAALLAWLTADDAVMARRLGVMYVIWDDHIWSSARRAEGWRPYAGCGASVPLASCGDTARHRNHVHLSFDWAGAMGRTSFWGATAPASIRPPAVRAAVGRPPAASRASRPPAGSGVGVATAPKVRSTGPLAAFAVAPVRPGSSGPAAVALQKALRMPVVTGRSDAATVSVVKGYQTSRRLPVTGTVAVLTWGSLDGDLAAFDRAVRAVPHPVIRPGQRDAVAMPVVCRALRLRVRDVLDADAVVKVKAFQRAHGIPTTGWVGPLTWAALRGL